MILFKPEVIAAHIHPAIWVALGIAYAERAVLVNAPLTVTSMADGIHQQGSYHSPLNTPSRLCQAIDLRTHDLSEDERGQWAVHCKALLEPLGYDVVHHTGEDGVPIHLHIEYQPKPTETDWAKSLLEAI